jgi:hypothetical protein
MASELIVQTLKGPTTGANANKVIIPSGQTLDASAGGLTLPTGVGGKLLQIVQTVTNSEVSVTATSFTDTGFSISITPTSASSSIFVMLTGGRVVTGSAGVHVQVRRGSTELSSNNIQRTGFASGGEQFPLSYSILDTSHGTTSALSYKVYALSTTGGSVAFNNGSVQNFAITAMEIAG